MFQGAICSKTYILPGQYLHNLDIFFTKKCSKIYEYVYLLMICNLCSVLSFILNFFLQIQLHTHAGTSIDYYIRINVDTE